MERKTGLWGKCRSLSGEWDVLVKGRRNEHLGLWVRYKGLNVNACCAI